MPEPDNFSPVEQFQDINKKIANKIVREYFKDVVALEDDLDLTTSRQALLKACLHKEDDTLDLTIGRNQLFAQYTTWARDQYPLIAGDLLSEVDASVTYKPRITLHFREDADDAEAGYQPQPMEISWRLVNETSDSITRAKLTAIGNKIKANFSHGNGYIFRKGRKVVRYRHLEKGYDFRIFARDLAAGKDLIREILQMNGDSIDTKLVKTTEVDDETGAFPYNPGFKTILNKRRTKPRRRPMVSVRFRYAYATVHGFSKPVYLYSMTDLVSGVLVAT